MKFGIREKNQQCFQSIINLHDHSSSIYHWYPGINYQRIIKKEFTWINKNPKIKNTTLCNCYDNIRLKNVKISSKIISLQYTMIKKLYSNTIPGWKDMLLHQIKTNQGLKFTFHLTLDISIQKLTKFQTYCKIIFKNWCLLLASSPILLSAIASQALWYDKHIKIDYKWIYLSEISKKGLN